MRNVMQHIAILTVCFALSSFAADTPSADQPRMALLIANVSYDDATLVPLPPGILVSTVHLYDELKSAGFRIYNDAPLVNLTREKLIAAFNNFAVSVPERALVVVYFAGHGTEDATVNNLIGVDKGLRGGTPLDDVLLGKFQNRNLTSIVIIDACRTGDGMAKPSRPLSNSLMAFSAQPGHSASPDTIYTDTLVRYLREPIRIEAVLQKVRNDVLKITHSQEPQVYGSLGQTVYIVRPASDLAEGQLMRSEGYYVLSYGRKRRIPDVPSFEPLGFNPSFAVTRSYEELSQIPDGDAYPSIASNVLTSITCTYYLFWGMKWCSPQSPDVDQSVPIAFRDGPVRALLPVESATIASGDLARLPSGVNFRFEGSKEVYRSGSESLRLLGPTELAALNPEMIFNLPAFMHGLLRPRAPDSNQLSGSLVVADPSRNQIFYARESVVVASNLLERKTLGAIDFKPGLPGLMVLAEKKGWLMVADSEQHVVHIIDARSHQRLDDIRQDFPAPTLITGLALSPDEQRLYVANQGGETVARSGSISVFDLTRNRQLVSTIGKVNCPEGMSITPDGDQIYVASQCGSGNDPVFVIDTSTEAVTAIPGFPVGHNVVVTPALGKAYVSRVGYPTADAAGKVGEIPAQVSVIDTSRKKLLGSWTVDLHSFAVTPDGNYVLAIGGLRMVVIDARNDQIINEVQFETPPAGVTVATTNDGKDVMCYVWLPKTPRLFFAGLGELLKSPSH
jgi:YVTN family beta-propeller protein